MAVNSKYASIIRDTRCQNTSPKRTDFIMRCDGPLSVICYLLYTPIVCTVTQPADL
jgi:hypothetical protein